MHTDAQLQFLVDGAAGALDDFAHGLDLMKPTSRMRNA
jgi:hypothetical protein